MVIVDAVPCARKGCTGEPARATGDPQEIAMSDATNPAAPATRTVDGVELPMPGTFTLDPSHSHVGFSVRHMMVSKVRGRFASFTGTVTVADEHTLSATVTVPVKEAKRPRTLDTIMWRTENPTWLCDGSSVKVPGIGSSTPSTVRVAGAAGLVASDMAIS